MDKVVWEQATTLRTRHRALLEDLGMRQVAEKLEEIDEALRFGLGGERSILAEQLVGVRYQGEADRQAAGGRPPDLLLVTVGYSPEPLLMSAAYHAPGRIAFLLEQNLRDSYLETLGELWDAMGDVLGFPEFHSSTILRLQVRDNPADLFQVVRGLVESRQGGSEHIVLDITGAKKSMVAGAFLAAGYFDIEASYVDYDHYDPVLRRPEPGRCRPVALPNPFRIFQLKEESRIEEAWKRRRYEECRQLLASTRQALNNPEAREFLRVDESAAFGRRLAAVDRLAEACFLWSEGFYADAGDCFDTLSPPMEPPTVAILRTVWPRRGDTAHEIVGTLGQERILSLPESPLAYFMDLLVWHQEESVRSRPRASFMRLYGAAESMIFFAFHVFLGHAPEQLMIESQPEGEHERIAAAFPHNKTGEVLDWGNIWGHMAVKFLRTHSSEALQALRANAKTSGWFEPRPSKAVKKMIDKTAKGIKLRIRYRPGPLSEELFSELNLNDFAGLRNKVVHWLAPVPVETALDLLGRFRDAVRELVPKIIDELSRGADAETSRALDLWNERLRRALTGDFEPEFVPPIYALLPRDLHLESPTEAPQ